MGRAEIRAARALEQNPIEACNEAQRRFYPELFNRFGQILDPRHQSYITYTGKTMLGQMIRLLSRVPNSFSFRTYLQNSVDSAVYILFWLLFASLCQERCFHKHRLVLA